MTASIIRPVLASFRYQVRVNTTTLSAVLIFIFTPIIFGTVATLFFRAHDANELSAKAVFGAAIVAVWTTSLMLSAITLGNDRWSGVIELLLATPSRLATLMFGKLLANSCQGLAAAVLSVTFVSLISGTSIPTDKPLLLLGSIVIALVAIGSLAFAWSPVLFVSQNAMSVFYMLDTGLVFVSALFFPLSKLPDWLEPLSAVSPLRWASQALSSASSDAAPARDVFEAWAALALLTVVYAAIGLVGFVLLERRLRRTGELSTL
jgi:ABC-2 type transport system permease protein